MKWLILSDSHGVISNMKQAVIRSSPDGILHLGDCWQDGQRLHQLFPQLPFYQVPGNFLSGSYSAISRYRKVTTCARVQVALGAKVVAVTPPVMPSSAAHATASA